MSDFTYDREMALVIVQDCLDTLVRYNLFLRTAEEHWLEPEVREIVLKHYIDESDRLIKDAVTAIAKARNNQS